MVTIEKHTVYHTYHTLCALCRGGPRGSLLDGEVEPIRRQEIEEEKKKHRQNRLPISAGALSHGEGGDDSQRIGLAKVTSLAEGPASAER